MWSGRKVLRAGRAFEKNPLLILLLVVFLAICGLVLGYLGHDWLSGVIFTGALISVPIIFVLNRDPKKEQKE